MCINKKNIKNEKNVIFKADHTLKKLPRKPWLHFKMSGFFFFCQGIVSWLSYYYGEDNDNNCVNTCSFLPQYPHNWGKYHCSKTDLRKIRDRLKGCGQVFTSWKASLLDISFSFVPSLRIERSQVPYVNKSSLSSPYSSYTSRKVVITTTLQDQHTSL